MPKYRSDSKKEKSSRKNKLRQMINKVHSKLDAEKDCREARNKRKRDGPRKNLQERVKDGIRKPQMKKESYLAVCQVNLCLHLHQNQAL